MIKPVLLYGAELWGFEVSDIIENVQNQFCKRFLKLPVTTYHVLARGECGRYPLFIDYYCKCIRYWIRLIRMDDTRYPYHCYRMLRRLDDAGRITWASKVKEILFKYGFGYVWVNENVGDEVMFLKAFKQRLTDCAKQEWRESVSESSKAYYYRNYMTDLTVAKYIFYNIPFKFRIALSKLRCSVHTLHIEVGRQNDVSAENRLCYVCNSHVIEDEFHFIMNCSAFDHLRDLYLPHLSNERKDITVFNRLMNADERITLSLAKYIYFAFKLRRELLLERLYSL